MSQSSEDSESNRSHRPLPKLVVDRAYINRLRQLELELDKTRSEATAARLDARAAELELRIRRLEFDPNLDGDVSTPAPSLRLDRSDGVLNTSGQTLQPRASFGTADLLIDLPRDRPLRHATVFRSSFAATIGHDIRIDHGEPSESLESSGKLLCFRSWDDVRRMVGSVGPTNVKPRPDVGEPDELSSPEPKSTAPVRRERDIVEASRPSVPTATIELETDDETTAEQNRKPVVWLISIGFHVLILILLAFFTLSSTPPGDQIAIAGSVAESDEIALETVQIETAEMPPTDNDPIVSEPVPSESEYEISEFGEISISDLITDLPPAPPNPLVDSLASSDASSVAAMSLRSDSDATMKFCGVEGGGNHFVYLVDSSGSMGDAFESARTELLQSIDLLKTDQRFYVIFFDAEPDYMRIASPKRDEPRSVYATPENKQALRRWAMTIKMDRGRAPYDALPFAIDLNPDVIFLLSDGEFPQKIEDLLGEINRIDNLFGDEGPVSIVHTIGYHSREGESRMRRIAKQNGGQYRHVPKP